MKSLPVKEIKTIADMCAFFAHLWAVEKMAFHPEDSFADAIVSETGEGFYSPAEAVERDRLMVQCWQVCHDPCSVALDLGRTLKIGPFQTA